MVRRRSPVCAPRRADRGTVSVEAALIMPVLVALVFGIIECGMLLKDWLGLASSVRGGARVVAAMPRQPAAFNTAAARVASELASVDPTTVGFLVFYKAGSTGLPVSGTFSSCTSCITYKWDIPTRSFSIDTTKSMTWTPLSENACVDPVAGTPDAVGIYLSINHKSITGMPPIPTQLTIGDRAVVRLEPIASSQGACR